MDTTEPSANFLISFIILLIIAGFTAYYADKKGRSPVGWFVLSVLIGFIAPLILYFLPSLRGEKPTTPPPPPSNVPLQDDKLWYYLDEHHKQYGPLSIIGLKELWDTGKLELSSYVWSEGMEKWEKVDNLPELKKALGKVQV